MERIAITGSSGYYGSRLIEHIQRIRPDVRILGLDVTPPRGVVPNDFIKMDIRSPGLHGVLAAFRPDTIVHLAFIVDPIHDESLMHDINIGGSSNLLAAAELLRPKRMLIASSATALGAWPDNPIPMDDHHPVRGMTNFLYARDKSELESLVVNFSERHPQIEVSWTRPCIVCGPGVDNYLSRMLLGHLAVVRPDGCNVAQQFVHEDDLAAATWHILERGGRGPFNIAPPDWIYLSDIARETERWMVSFPLWWMNFVSTVCWGLRLPLLRYPPAMNQFIRHSWVVAPNRLCGELGFEFQYSSLEAFREMYRNNGRIVEKNAKQSRESRAA